LVTLHVRTVRLFEVQLPEGVPVATQEANVQSFADPADQDKVVPVAVVPEDETEVGTPALLIVPPVTVMVPAIAG